MRRWVYLLVLLVCGCSWPGPSGPGHSLFRSTAYPVSDVIPPLRGPAGSAKHLLVRDHPAELVWLTGCSVSVAEAEAGGKPLSETMLTYTNVDLGDVRRHRDLLGTEHLPGGRIFSLCAGMSQVQLPAGFGVPMLSSEPLTVSTGLMNPDPYQRQTEAVFLASLDYVYQRGLERPMVPLWVASAHAMVSLDDRPTYFGVLSKDTLRLGPGCATWPPATDQVFTDPMGQRFAADWMVPPRETVTTRTLVTRLLNLPHDTTLHYASAQIIPGARRLVLVDLTDQKTLVTLELPPFDGKAQTNLPVFSSLPGLPMYASHEYELRATFENKAPAPSPAKAAMSLFLRDQEFSLASVRPQ